MAEQKVYSAFCYGYRPLNHRTDGGFTINLYTNNQLVFCVYNKRRQILQTDVFQVGAEVLPQIQRMVGYAAPWLRSVPDRITNSGEGEHEYSFGFNRWPLFRIEDLEQQVSRDFRTVRGHYSRLVYSLLEDIASLLAGYGILLQPDRFNWDQAMAVRLTQNAPAVSSGSQIRLQA